MRTDPFSKELRREVMSNIGSKNSQAERIVFSYLRKEKVYFQKHYKKIYGTPDVAKPRKKLAVFIDGDFWHGRRLKETIERRGVDDYWSMKILNNVKRDRRQEKLLTQNGWNFLRVWESGLKRKSTREEELVRIKNFLAKE